MAILKKKEFAAMCHTTVAVVNTNIHRGKIIYDKEDKTIDSEDPLNQEFFEKYIELSNQKKAKKTEVNADELYEKVVEKATKDANNRTKEKQREKSRQTSQKKVDWDLRKKKADAVLQERKAEKELLNLEKLAGKLIPVDLVFRVLKIHNQDIFATFQNDAENLASIYCDILAGGDRKKLSEITDKLNHYLETIINRAKEVSIASIEAAVDEYKEVRSRGERK